MIFAAPLSCALSVGGLTAPARSHNRILMTTSLSEPSVDYESQVAAMTEEQQTAELARLLGASEFRAILSAEELTTLEAELERRQSACVPVPEGAYWCNDQGCWVGSVTPTAIPEPEPAVPPDPVTLPDGRTFSMTKGVQSHKEYTEIMKTRKKTPVGIFAPAVLGAKAVMGEKELNKLRAEVIGQHSKVISNFVDTSESPFGQLVVRQLFEAADKDGNGTLDREEVRDALYALGFTFVKDKQIGQIFKRADTNGDEVIDFEEFVKETPKTLRTSLIKLAKQNGHDLGFLA